MSLPSWAKPPVPAAKPKPKPRSRIAVKAERALMLQLRDVQRRINVKSRRKHPPKALADYRANLGRMRALMAEIAETTNAAED